MTPAGPDPAGDLPEGDLEEPVVPPHHELTSRIMALTGTVAEHQLQLAQLSGTAKEHHARLLVVENTTQAVTGLLDRVAALEPPTPDTAAHPETPNGPDPRQADHHAEPGTATFDLRELIGWVRENVALVLEREIPASRSPNWCRQWWRHAEAIARLEAARRCWLDAGSDYAGLSVFFQHLDHQLAVLMGEGGPFAGCREGQHTPEPASTRCLGQDDPDEGFYTEFDRLRAPAIPNPAIPAPAQSHSGGHHDPVPSPVTGAGGTGGGVTAADLMTHRRNGRGR